MKQKHYIKCLAIGLFSLISLLFWPAMQVHADQSIYSITIDITLDDEGNAEISETWDVYTDEGTEWYLVQGNLGEIKIKDFSVTDETGEVYENIGEWDVDRTLEQKAGKCGIVNKGGGDYELCWGLGSHGLHTYTASYRMTNFVKGFDDYCGFNQRLINDELSACPWEINVNIRKEGTDFASDEVGVWAFGFNGEIYVQEGEVQAWSNANLDSDDYVTIMCQFPRDMFDTRNIHDGSFDEMKERALKNSDYESAFSGISTFISIISPIVFAILFIIFIVGIIISANGSKKITTFEEARRLAAIPSNVKRYKSPAFWVLTVILLIGCFPLGLIYLLLNLINNLSKDEPDPTLSGNAYSAYFLRKEVQKSDYYYRDIPFNGSLNELYSVSHIIMVGTANNNIIGAYFLKWLQEGCISVREELKNGISGSMGKTAPSIIMMRLPMSSNESEQALFTLLDTASGGDHILQEKELYRWAKSNYSKVDAALKAIKEDGEKQLRNDGFAGKIFQKSLFLNSYPVAFTDPGRLQVHYLSGLLRFFKNYTLLNERGVQDVALWDQYLIIAQLFGMADEVAKTFANIYPNYFNDPARNYYGYSSISTFHAISSISTAGISGSRAGGGGGGSSSGGGGGGSSGGGSGGGCR